MESLILGLPVGSYCIHQSFEHDVKIELLDGLQRWGAIFAYYDNEFPVFGLFAKDLNDVELRSLGMTLFPVIKAERFTEAEKHELFTRLAYGGTPNTPDQTVGTARRLK